MSTRTYNLRTRAEVGPANQSRLQNNPVSRRVSPSPVRDLPPHLSGNRLPFSSPSALYSDVVASRSPSPLKETSVLVETHPVLDESERERPSLERSQPTVTLVPTISRENVEIVEEHTSSEADISPKDLGDAPWTTVKRRRARSLESFDIVRRSHSESNGAKGLTSDQVQTVKAAADAMSKSQKELLDKRKKKLTHQRKGSSSSRGEGPSQPKGKGIDPREWGNVNISQESLDVEAQDAAWKSLAQNKRLNSRDNRSSSIRLPAESRPVAQLAKGSYLGMTLCNVGRPSPERRHRPRGGSPSPSDPGSPRGGQSGSENRSPSGERTRRRRDNRHGRNGHRRRRSSSSSSNLVIKPIPPKEYNGSVDTRAYHRFVRESEAYLRDGKVRGECKIFLLSHYLTDKAYDFYTQKVANNEAYWTLSQFYYELFNYCFPVDYRMQMRKTLARCYQNERSVAEYTHELTELFNMIGDVPERDQVLKFWNGARSVIQKGLWRDNLNPEISSWANVVAQAEIIEISENVAERRDRRSGPSNNQAGSSNANGGGSTRSRHRNGHSSVRSVTYESRSNPQSRATNLVPRRGNHSFEPRSGSSRGREHAHSSRGRTGYGGSMRSSHTSGSGQRNTPRLSDKEKAERLAAGQCFVCRETGHFSRDCPTKKVVKSYNGKPPGTASFNIEPTVDEDYSDGVEVLDGLPLGAVSFKLEDARSGSPDSSFDEMEDIPPWPISDWRKHYPYWGQSDIFVRRAMGECYLMVADAVLTLGQPYPGDEPYQSRNIRPDTRFMIRINRSVYEIHDQLTDERVSVDERLLRKPQFNLSRWYAVRRTKTLNLDRARAYSYEGRMENAVSIVACKLLTDGIHTYYPCIRPNQNPQTRFKVCQRTGVKEEYMIKDKDLRLHVSLPQTLLEDPNFDLVGWYIDYLSQQDWAISQAANEVEPEEHRCSSAHVFVGCSHPDAMSPRESSENTAESIDDEVPDLEPPDESEDEGDDETVPQPLNDSSEPVDDDSYDGYVSDDDFDDIENGADLVCALESLITEVLSGCQPFPGDGPAVDPTYRYGDGRFVITPRESEEGVLEVYDRIQGFETHISVTHLLREDFSVGRWFAERCAVNQSMPQPWRVAQEWFEARRGIRTTLWPPAVDEDVEVFTREMTPYDSLELSGVQVDRHKYPSLQRNSAQIKGNSRILPKPVVIKLEVMTILCELFWIRDR
jgi:Zinc knuckle